MPSSLHMRPPTMKTAAHPTAHKQHWRKRAPRMRVQDADVSGSGTYESAPVGGTLYSLLHLGGFHGDLAFYSKYAKGRVLELGCGDGRVAAALCMRDAQPAVIQRLESSEHATMPPLAEASLVSSYLGIERVESLAEKARAKVAACNETSVVMGDFLVDDPTREDETFDTVIMSANTLFSSPRHSDVLDRCAKALKPGGVLLFDVYNAIFWHIIEEEIGGDDDKDSEEEEPGMLVRVVDEEGRDWSVYEREPEINRTVQSIACGYDFRLASSLKTRGQKRIIREKLMHHYLLPEELIHLLDDHGFDIVTMSGDFLNNTFEPDDSDHVVVVARKRA